MNINSATGWLLPTELNLVIIILSLRKINYISKCLRNGFTLVL